VAADWPGTAREEAPNAGFGVDAAPVGRPGVETAVDDALGDVSIDIALLFASDAFFVMATRVGSGFSIFLLLDLRPKKELKPPPPLSFSLVVDGFRDIALTWVPESDSAPLVYAEAEAEFARSREEDLVSLLAVLGLLADKPECSGCDCMVGTGEALADESAE